MTKSTVFSGRSRGWAKSAACWVSCWTKPARKQLSAIWNFRADTRVSAQKQTAHILPTIPARETHLRHKTLGPEVLNMAHSGSETEGCSRDVVDPYNPVDQVDEMGVKGVKEEKGMMVMSSQPGEGSSLPSLGGDIVLGGESNKNKMGRGKGERKRSIDEESPLVAKKSLKPIEEEVLPNINSRLPPELLAAIFQFLPFKDLKNALLVCR